LVWSVRATSRRVDVWPIGLAPFIRLSADGSGGQQVDDGIFGLLPSFVTELAAGRRTYNARSETVAIKPSFRDAWRRGQRCIVPVEVIYEPCWETGQSVRWAITLVPWAGPLEAQPQPLPPRAPRATSGKLMRRDDDAGTGLF
jgi:putative SOS response-associated peptidase YedK